MGKVNNKRCIRNLSVKSMKRARLRNGIAILAIALTAMLFTAVLTIAGSINASFQQQNFRQVGGDFHGSFKNVTLEQIDEFSQDPLIRQWGVRRLLGMPQDGPFRKWHVEVGYADQTCADSMFCTPSEGRLPEEGTLEAATDTRVLGLLGVEPELGAQFTVTYDLGVGTESPVPVTQTFTLCGWWEYDGVVQASHILVAESYTDQTLEGYVAREKSDLTGSWDMYVNFQNAYHIREDLEQVLENHGCQSQEAGADDYVDVGVNWGYTGAQLSHNMDMGTIMGIGAAVLLIVFTGYLIIYNIFRISVTGDIRFYGLLKTIGATGRQIRRMVRRQALILSCVGIPIGLASGWLAAAVLMPVIMSTLAYQGVVMSVSPWIFAGAAAFAFLTVLISCYRPARTAGKVSPVEAVRYTESSGVRRKTRRGRKGARITRMAWANLGRNRWKTALVVVSLALAVVLLNAAYTFTSGFDMDKYLQKYVCTDFIFGHADYFQSNFGNEDQGITQEQIQRIQAEGQVTGGGVIYGQTTTICQHITEEQYRTLWQSYLGQQQLEEEIARQERDEDGLLLDRAQLYGMEDFPLSKTEVLEGDLARLKEEGNYIAAVVEVDDYDQPIEISAHCQVGDQVTLTYVDQWEYIDSRTGAPATDETPDAYWEARVAKSHDVVYTVCARVTVKNSMGYRFYGAEQYILPADVFCRETGSATAMNYLFDVADADIGQMEAFLREYTEQEASFYSYESKDYYINQFDSFRGMFLLMGGALSGVIGFIGILNFINAVITSVISRKREFALLQAVGMTSRQMKRMLVTEGCLYGISAIAAALVISLAAMPLLSEVLTGMFWFYSHHTTVAPVLAVMPVFLLFGTLIPLIACRAMARESVVERIRETE